MSFTGDKAAYKLFNKKGEQTSYEMLIKKIKDADIVFFGESHNNPISHWLELEVTKDFYKLKNGKLVLGAEMFESDNQLIIDEYLAKKYAAKKFEAECRLWPNYSTDYKPLINFALNNNIPFIATNIPRRYASIVYKKGFEGLDDLSTEAKEYIAPLPIFYDAEQDAYKSMREMSGMPAHMTVNLPKAQAIKDATMAYFIHKNLKKGNAFLHYNGSYHSDKFQGIIYYLRRLNPNLKIVTITSVSQEDIEVLSDENKKLADFIIAIDEDMTTTY
jgi:uncharacterized iron-regulated protein